MVTIRKQTGAPETAGEFKNERRRAFYPVVQKTSATSIQIDDGINQFSFIFQNRHRFVTLTL